MLCAERKLEIEQMTYALRSRVYDERRSYWPHREPRGLEVADPDVVALSLGIRLDYLNEIAFQVPSASRYETAGLLDRRRGMIVVAERYGHEVKRFTAAHEIGHWQLHKDEIVLHRDLPISGLERHTKDPIEQEADYFAASLLMPRKYIADQFRERFPSDGPFVMDEHAIHHLRVYNRESLLYPEPGSLVREKVLASAKSYAGRPFISLASQFRVSIATMAIRIKELGLVRSR